MVKISSPGKIILFGEHAVVHGKMAIATSIDLRTTVDLCEIDGDILEVHFQGRKSCFLMGKAKDSISEFNQKFSLLPLHDDDGVLVVDDVDNSNSSLLTTTQLTIENILELSRFSNNHNDKNKNKNVSNYVEFLDGCVKYVTEEVLNTFVHVEDDQDKPPLLLVLFAFLLLNQCAHHILPKDFPKKSKGISLKIETQIPMSSGLGSSASVSVCLVTAFLLHFNLMDRKGLLQNPEIMEENKEQRNFEEIGTMRKSSKNIVNEWAYLLERVNHGTPSGIDNSVCCFGGTLTLKEGRIQSVLSLLPKQTYNNQNSQSSLRLLDKQRLLIIHTKINRSTKNLVAGVRDRKNKDPQLLNQLLEDIQKCTEDFIQTLKYSILDGDGNDFDAKYVKEMEDEIDRNQSLLEKIGVSHPAIKEICDITIKYGMHSKLTGAGGGGCVICLVKERDNPEKLIAELKERGFDCFTTAINCKGVYIC